MRVALITRHFIPNYGSLLQAMATQQAIENLGHSCDVIDYIREDETFRNREKTLLNRKQRWNGSKGKRFLYLMLRQPESIAAGRKFERWQRQYLNLTKRYSGLEQLKADPPAADVYMTGSDQVWGPVENGSYDSAYCLSFVDGNRRKMAYAASFGHTELSEEERGYYQTWLTCYQRITVREESAVKILEELGMEASWVLDPTLLFDAAYWAQYVKPIAHKKYILVYQLHNDSRLNAYAKKAAKKKGLPLIRLSVSFHQLLRGGKLIWAPDLGTFLSYIKNAECMITDSFHGTAFAINFNTPFIEVMPNNNTGTRNRSILRLTGLQGRILQKQEDLALVDQKIDFQYANKILEQKRKESFCILKSMIEG